MRKHYLTAISSIILLGIFSSCKHTRHHGNDVNITISESENIYRMSAYFDNNKTRKVHEFMNHHLGRGNDMSFVNAEIDGTVTLDDNTTFYIKTEPGELEIKLDKEANSYGSCAQVKEMCEGIKTVIEKD